MTDEQLTALIEAIEQNPEEKDAILEWAAVPGNLESLATEPQSFAERPRVEQFAAEGWKGPLTGERGGTYWVSPSGEKSYEEPSSGQPNGEQSEEKSGKVESADSDVSPEVHDKMVKSPVFKEWFGDWESDPANASKVVDGKGNPLVVYHGTHGDFEEFQVRGDVGGKYFGSGFYFTPDEDYAGHFASDGFGADQGKVMALMLNIRKPYVVTNPYKETKKIREEGFGGWDDYNEHLKSQGYDGLKIIRFEQAIGREVEEWVAFEPTQIKSATGNRGTFDPKSANIKHGERTVG